MFQIEPISSASGTSGNVPKERPKGTLHQLRERGMMKNHEMNSWTDTKVTEKGEEGGVPGTGAGVLCNLFAL